MDKLYLLLCVSTTVLSTLAADRYERLYPSNFKDVSQQFAAWVESLDTNSQQRDPLPQSQGSRSQNKQHNNIATLHAQGGDYVGSRCKLASGQISRCLVITECPSALRDLRYGIRHIRCGFKGRSEIVCCPDAVKSNSNLVNGGDNHVPLTFPTEASTPSYGGYTYRPGSNRPTRAPQEGTMPTRGPNTGNSAGVKAENACKRYNSQAVPRVGLFIQGGVEAELTEFPHMALIGYPPNGVMKTQGKTNDGRDISWRCGGSLISEKYVLTAAHCVAYLGEKKPILVRLGELDWSDNNDGAEPQDFTIKKITLHPEYKVPLAYHDIALLELNAPVNFNAGIQPACLPKPTDQKLDNRNLIISGWGDTEFAVSGMTSKLMKAELRTIAINECNRTYMTDADNRRKLPRALLNYGHLCAQDKINSADTCQGDSGGPLQERMSPPSPLFRVHGVTSIGKACTGKFPTLYAKVADYVDWIERVVWP